MPSTREAALAANVFHCSLPSWRGRVASGPGFARFDSRTRPAHAPLRLHVSPLPASFTAVNAPAGWIRVVMLLWATLQLALPSALTLIDANLESATASAIGPHVESTSTPACQRAHGADCTFCQFLSSYIGTARAEMPAQIAAVAHVRPPAMLTSLGASAAGRLPGSRAPPIG